VKLPAFAAECQRLLDSAVQQSIDISGWQGAQQQTRCKPPLLAIDGTERRMDRLQTCAADPAVNLANKFFYLHIRPIATFVK